MNVNSCKAVLNGKVKHKGKPSLEWYMGSHPQYYCYGYIDKMTDELLPECKNCLRHVNNAQNDLEQYNRQRMR